MLPLIIAPNKILRQSAEAIKLPLSTEILNLIEQMFEAMPHYKGIGLAAPQINKSVRLIVIATDKGPRAFINPEIIESTPKIEEMEEGCLSLPGVFGIVPRPYGVSASFIDQSGSKRVENFEGMMARVYQHEVDHINGILFIDKASEIVNGQELLSKYRGD